MTSKLQLTIPKAIAEAHGIAPGMELEFESADDVIRLRVAASATGTQASASATQHRLRAFDDATRRQAQRDANFRAKHADLISSVERGWTRESLYDRGLAR